MAGSSAARAAQHLERVAHGGQRVAQLVAEHGQELVLGLQPAQVAAPPPRARAPLLARLRARSMNWPIWPPTVANIWRRSVVGRPDLAAEELDHAQHLVAEPDGERERAVQALRRRHGARGKFVSTTHVRDPAAAAPLCQTRPGRPIPGAKVASG